MLSFRDFFIMHGLADQSPRVLKPFHDQILTAMARVVVGDLPDGKKNLMINMPPRHGKTFLARALVEYGLGCFPDSQFIYTSYSATRAEKETVAIRQTCRADWYRELFPAVVLDKEAADRFTTTAGGQVFGVGAGGSVTGEGAGVKRPAFGGAIIIDDPIKADDARSEAALEHAREWYTGVLKNRRNCDTTPIIFIEHRLAPEDLAGHILATEGDEWHVLAFEGLNEATGEALWPETCSPRTWLSLKRVDPFTFYSQGQQKPQVPGGNMIKAEWWGSYNAATYNTSSLIFLTADTALKAKTQNDDTSMGVWHATPRYLDCLDNDTGKMEFPELLRRAKALWKKWEPHGAVGFYIEDKASGPSLYQMLAEQGIPCIPWSPQDYEFPMDKVGRVKYSLFPIAGGRVRLPDDWPAWCQPFVDECSAYSGKDSDVDNQVDMTTMAVSIWKYKGADLADVL